MRRQGLRSAPVACAAAVAVGISAAASAATIQLRMEAAPKEVEVSQQFEISIIADIAEPIVGFGMDLMFDQDRFQLLGAETGNGFLPIKSADEAFVGGLAYPKAISGDDVLLATATFMAMDAGEGLFDISVTPGDLTRGFAEVPERTFSTITLGDGSPTVKSSEPLGFGGGGGGGGSSVPEPSSMLLLAAAGLMCGMRRIRG